MYQLCFILFIGIFRCAFAPVPSPTSESFLAYHIILKYDTNGDLSLDPSEFNLMSLFAFHVSQGLQRAKFGDKLVFQDKSAIVTLFNDILVDYGTNELSLEVLTEFLKNSQNMQLRRRFAVWLIYLADDSDSGSNKDGVLDANDKVWLDEHFDMGYTRAESVTNFENLQDTLVRCGYSDSVVNETIVCEKLVNHIAGAKNWYSVIFPLAASFLEVAEKEKNEDDDTHYAYPKDGAYHYNSAEHCDECSNNSDGENGDWDYHYRGPSTYDGGEGNFEDDEFAEEAYRGWY